MNQKAKKKPKASNELVNQFWDILKYYHRDHLITEERMAEMLGLSGKRDVQLKLVSPLALKGEPIYSCPQGIGLALKPEDLEETMATLQAKKFGIINRIRGCKIAIEKLKAGYDPRERQNQLDL